MRKVTRYLLENPIKTTGLHTYYREINYSHTQFIYKFLAFTRDYCRRRQFIFRTDKCHRTIRAPQRIPSKAIVANEQRTHDTNEGTEIPAANLGAPGPDLTPASGPAGPEVRLSLQLETPLAQAKRTLHLQTQKVTQESAGTSRQSLPVSFRIRPIVVFVAVARVLMTMSRAIDNVSADGKGLL